jgi:hypothetical protein
MIQDLFAEKGEIVGDEVEQVAPRRLFDKVCVDNIAFETDFPHPTSLYGDEVHDRIETGLADCAHGGGRGQARIRVGLAWCQAPGTFRTLSTEMILLYYPCSGGR